jgi:TP901 family phage tail tape measure protein
MSQNNILHEEIKIDFTDTKGTKSAVKALQDMAKAAGVSDDAFANVNQSAKNAKSTFTKLNQAYNKMSEDMKKSAFGQQVKAQLDVARKGFVNFQAEAFQAKEELKKLEDEAKRMSGIEVDVDVNVNQKGGKLSGFSDMLDKAGFGGASKAVGGLGEMLGGTLTKGALLGGAAIAGTAVAIKETVDVTKKAIEKSAEFGKSISELGALVGVSGKELDIMREQVMNVAKDTNVACAEVARNFALVGSALPDLLNDADGMELVSRAAITLSKAGLMPLDEATNALTNTMAQFDISADQASTIIDILANASNAGNAEINDINQTLLTAGVSAKQAGLSLGETASMIEVLASKGMKGAEAGTALRNVLTNMSTKGIDEINPKVVGVQTALTNLSKHANDASWMMKVFGMNGQTAATILAQNIPTYKNLVEAMDEVGSAETMAAANTDNLASKWEETKTKWENFLSSMSVDGNSPLMEGVQAIQDIIDAVETVFAELGDSDGLGALGDSLGETFTALGELIENIITIVGELVDAVIDCVDSFGLLEGVSAIWNGIMKAIELVSQLLGDVMHLFKRAANSFKEMMSGMWGKVSEWPFVKAISDGIKRIIEGFKEVKKWWNKIHSLIWSDQKEEKPKKKNNKTTKTTTGTTTGDSTNTNSENSKTKKENPRQTYNNAIQKAELMKELGLYSDYGLENEKQAVEAKVKAIDDYINKLEDTTDSINKNKTQINQLRRARQIYKNQLEYIGMSLDDNKIVTEANEAYSEAIYKLNEERENGWITQDEYNSQYIKAIQELIKKYKDVGIITQELTNKINEKENEIDKITVQSKEDKEAIEKQASMFDFRLTYADAPKMNDMFKKLYKGATEILNKIADNRYKTGEELQADIDAGLANGSLKTNWKYITKGDLEDMVREIQVLNHDGNLVPEPFGNGDYSNYSMWSKSGNKVGQEYGQDSMPKSVGRFEGGLMSGSLEKNQKQLQALLDKYQELENIALNIFNNGNQNNYADEIYADLENLEKQISAFHDVLQEQLTFQIQFQGFQDAMQYATDFSSSLSTIAQFGDAWEQAGENANGFVATMERFALVMSTVQSIITAVNTAINVFNAIQDVLQAKNASTEAVEAATAGATVTAKNAIKDATLSSAAAKIFEAHSAIPFAGVPTATSMVQAMLATMAEVKAASKAADAFANGGIVDYGSFYGDSTLARVNKGEMILNQAQQGNLFNSLNNQVQAGTGEVTFKIKGDALYGVLKNHNKIKAKTGHSINFD